MPEDILAQHHLLPEMKLLDVRRGAHGGTDFVVCMTSGLEVCPKCALPSRSVYDRRWVSVRDEPMRRAEARLVIHKRRFWCRACRLPFTEPVGGIIKGKRTTERYARAVQQACEEYVDLKTVRRRFRCSRIGPASVRSKPSWVTDMRSTPRPAAPTRTRLSFCIARSMHCNYAALTSMRCGRRACSNSICRS